jgi:hypothetical protein
VPGAHADFVGRDNRLLAKLAIPERLRLVGDATHEVVTVQAAEGTREVTGVIDTDRGHYLFHAEKGGVEQFARAFHT